MQITRMIRVTIIVDKAEKDIEELETKLKAVKEVELVDYEAFLTTLKHSSFLEYQTWFNKVMPPGDQSSVEQAIMRDLE